MTLKPTAWYMEKIAKDVETGEAYEIYLNHHEATVESWDTWIPEEGGELIQKYRGGAAVEIVRAYIERYR